MSRSDQYLDNFSYGVTQRALYKNKKMRLYQKQYEYHKAKMNRKARMISILLASGLTISIAANSLYSYLMESKPIEEPTIKTYSEQIEVETGLSTKPTEQLNKEIVAASKLKDKQNQNQKKDTLPKTKPKKSNITIGGNGSDEVEAFLNNEENEKYANGASTDYIEATEQNAGAFVYKYSSDYGVDPSIIASICYQESSLQHYESCPGGYNYNGYGVGFTQQESPSGEKVMAYNYNTTEDDVEYITMDNACDIAKNIKIGAMQWQNSINHYKGNVLLAIQSHNFGQTMLDKVLFQNYFKLENLEKDYPNVVNNLKADNPEIYQFMKNDYPTQYGVLSEEYPETYNTLWKQSKTYWDTIKTMIYTDYGNTSWINWVKDAYENPFKYLSNWEFSHYGDGSYVAHVLSHCPTSEIKYTYDNSNITFDLDTMTVVSSEKINQNVR